MKNKLFNKRIFFNWSNYLNYLYFNYKYDLSRKIYKDYPFKKYIFLRIPKTASSKFIEIVKNNVSLNKLIETFPDSWEMFGVGNHSYRVFNLKPQMPYIVTLRDPIMRAQSAFYFSKTRENDNRFIIENYLIKKINTFENFCEWLYSYNILKFLVARLLYITSYHLRDDYLSFFSKKFTKPFFVVNVESFSNDMKLLIKKINQEENLNINIDNDNLEKKTNKNSYKIEGLSIKQEQNINRFLKNDIKIYNQLQNFKY